MNISKETHPKTYKIFGEHLLSKTPAAKNEEMAKTFPIDKIIDIAVSKGNRVLYDLLDAEGLFVSVWYEKMLWNYKIEGILAGGGCDTRIDAENTAFQIAVDRLEKR